MGGNLFGMNSKVYFNLELMSNRAVVHFNLQISKHFDYSKALFDRV